MNAVPDAAGIYPSERETIVLVGGLIWPFWPYAAIPETTLGASIEVYRLNINMLRLQGVWPFICLTNAWDVNDATH